MLRGGKQLIRHRYGQQSQKDIGEGNVIEIERWRLQMGSLISFTTIPLSNLAVKLNEAKENAERFNPQDNWEDAWFKKQMSTWSREKVAERLLWAMKQSPKKTSRWDVLQVVFGSGWGWNSKEASQVPETDSLYQMNSDIPDVEDNPPY